MEVGGDALDERRLEIVIPLLIFLDRARRGGNILIISGKFVRQLGLAGRLFRPANIVVLFLPRLQIPIDFMECSSSHRDILDEVLENRPAT